MARYLIDTNIVRFYVEGNKEVEAFWDKCRQNNDTLLLSMVTVGELRSQMVVIKQQYRKPLRQLIQAFPHIPATDPNDQRAHAYRRYARMIRLMHENQHKSHQPRLPALADAKIAVDALKEEITIVTNNTKDFHIARFLGAAVYDPIRDLWFYPIERTNTRPAHPILEDNYL